MHEGEMHIALPIRKNISQTRNENTVKIFTNAYSVWIEWNCLKHCYISDIELPTSLWVLAGSINVGRLCTKQPSDKIFQRYVVNEDVNIKEIFKWMEELHWNSLTGQSVPSLMSNMSSAILEL